MVDEDEFSPQRQAAIAAALNNNWSDAITLNESLLKKNPKEVETLNRLARAYVESGLIGKAKSTYKQVLALDPYNTIAAKNIAKLAGLTKKDLTLAAKSPTGNQTPISADLFLEEPGRTKVIDLVDLAMTKIVATIHTGDPVNFETKGMEVIVTINDKRLGKLPPEYAAKIALALNNSGEFFSVIKSVVVKKAKAETAISIFVKEITHSPKLGPGPIFPSNGNQLTSFVREDTLPLMDNRQDMVVVESDDEILEDTNHLPPTDENDDHNGPPLEDEEEFHN